jgi:homoserine dehydrogenase
VSPDEINAEGISKLTLDDIDFEEKAQAELKLIAYFENADNGAIAYVAPTYVARGNLLASVSGVFNAVMVDGNALGVSMYYGKGAGKLATASAVVADVVDAARKGSSTMFRGWDDEPVKTRADAYDKCRYMVKFDEKNADKAKALFEGAEEIGIIDGKFALITSPMDSPAFEDKFDSDNGIIDSWIEIYE